MGKDIYVPNKTNARLARLFGVQQVEDAVRETFRPSFRVASFKHGDVPGDVPVHPVLVGGSATPLKNMKVNWDD